MQMSFVSVIELILIELIVMLPYSHMKDLVLSFIALAVMLIELHCAKSVFSSLCAL